MRRTWARGRCTPRLEPPSRARYPPRSAALIGVGRRSLRRPLSSRPPAVLRGVGTRRAGGFSEAPFLVNSGAVMPRVKVTAPDVDGGACLVAEPASVGDQGCSSRSRYHSRSRIRLPAAARAGVVWQRDPGVDPALTRDLPRMENPDLADPCLRTLGRFAAVAGWRVAHLLPTLARAISPVAQRDRETVIRAKRVSLSHGSGTPNATPRGHLTAPIAVN